MKRRECRVRFYANENFPAPSVNELRAPGHDVLTTSDAGNANRKIPDSEVLRYAAENGRVMLTLNRRDFIRLHERGAAHTGLVVCHEDLDFQRLAHGVHAVAGANPNMIGHLVNVRTP